MVKHGGQVCVIRLIVIRINVSDGILAAACGHRGHRDTAAANAPIWRDQLLAPITLLLIVQTHHSAHHRHQTLYLTPALLGGMVTDECNQ